jgi:hypothetical protein
LYQYVDRDGATHFVSNRAEVPAAFRAQARPVDSEVSNIQGLDPQAVAQKLAELRASQAAKEVNRSALSPTIRAPSPRRGRRRPTRVGSSGSQRSAALPCGPKTGPGTAAEASRSQPK